MRRWWRGEKHSVGRSEVVTEIGCRAKKNDVVVGLSKLLSQGMVPENLDADVNRAIIYAWYSSVCHLLHAMRLCNTLNH